MSSEPGVRETPYLHLRLTDGAVKAEGQFHYTVGHRLADGEGVHSSWQWDGTSLELRNCRFGLYPLFYFSAPAEFCVSSSLTEVLRRVGPQELDDDAIAVFLRIGFFLEDDTPFVNVKAVPPGSDWRWTDDGLVRSERVHEPGASCAASRQARLDDYVDLFRQSMKRRPAVGKVVLPLSGGRDSRHILFELLRSGAPRDGASLECVSSEFPPTRSLEDVRIAKGLCQELGLRHRVFHHDRSYVSAVLEKNEVTSFCSDEHTWAAPMCVWINRTDATVYDGLGGDVLSAGLFSSRERLEAFRAGKPEQFVRGLFAYAEGELKVWLRPDALVRFSHERAVARAVAAVAPHCDQANPVASFYFGNRTRREIALYSCCMIQPDKLVYFPYLDHALFDYLMSIPGEDLDDKSFHTDAIARGYPQWADHPYGLGDGDADAARLTEFSRRRWNTRLALDTAGYLLKRRDNWVNRAAVVPRLAKLVGAVDTGSRFWMSVEKIVWAAQLERKTSKTQGAGYADRNRAQTNGTVQSRLSEHPG